MDCQYAPEEVKAKLRKLKKLHHDERAKLPKGSQQKFFAKLYQRLHVASVGQKDNTASSKA